MNNQILWQSRLAPRRDPGARLCVTIYMAEKSLPMTPDSFPIFRDLLSPTVQLKYLILSNLLFKGLSSNQISKAMCILGWESPKSTKIKSIALSYLKGCWNSAGWVWKWVVEDCEYFWRKGPSNHETSKPALLWSVLTSRDQTTTRGRE